jgi:ABC-type polysaccharide/polyol phosphate transport system ATPase subunit
MMWSHAEGKAAVGPNISNLGHIGDNSCLVASEKRRRSGAFAFILERSRNQQRSSHEFWALRHVSFTVERGDTVGIIGRNGSGKSTLLRVVAGIYPPDEGKVSVDGEVSTLFFGLGAGFNPELSGRDNIYMNGVMIGLTKDRID